MTKNILIDNHKTVCELVRIVCSSSTLIILGIIFQSLTPQRFCDYINSETHIFCIKVTEVTAICLFYLLSLLIVTFYSCEHDQLSENIYIYIYPSDGIILFMNRNYLNLDRETDTYK